MFNSNCGKLAHVFRWYGFFGFIRLAFDICSTRILFPQARLVRRPYFIRSAKPIKFGSGFTSGVCLRIDIEYEGFIDFGSGIQINDYVHIAVISHISIGDNTLVASRVFISDHNHGRFDGITIENGPDTPPAQRPLHAKPVRIGKNVWIGESVCVLPGVTIGDGVVIGAGSVVTRDIPARCLAAGNPARVIRQWDDTSHKWKRV